MGDLDRDEPILGPVQDQGRDADCGQHMPDVDVLVHPVERFEGTGARAPPELQEKGLHIVVLEAAERADCVPCLLPRAEDLQVTLHLPLVLFLGPAPGIIGCPHPARETAADDDCRGPFRVRRREQDGHRRALGQAEQSSALRPDRVHDGANVVHPGLQRRRAAHPVGHAGSALVEANQPARGRQPLEERDKTLHPPGDLDVSDEPGNEDEIERSSARHLVRDVDIPALRVMGLGHFHERSVSTVVDVRATLGHSHLGRGFGNP